MDRTTTDPFGNKFVIVADKYRWPGLLTIECLDRQKSWKKPAQIAGHYTSKDKAVAALNGYLAAAWMYNDQEAEKLAKRGKKKEEVKDVATD